MNWLKKIVNKELKETKINDKILFNELKELERQYIYTSHNIAENYYMMKGRNLWSSEDALKELEGFIEAEIAIRDRIRELRKIDTKNKENV